MTELHNGDNYHQYYSRVGMASVSSAEELGIRQGNVYQSNSSLESLDIFQNQGATHNNFPSEREESEKNEPESEQSLSGQAHQDPRYKYGSVIFLIVSVASALLVLALEAFMFGVITKHRDEFVEHRKYLEMSIFLALFIFAAIYQVIITLIGLHSKNMLLLSMLCVFYAVMLVYTGIQYLELSRELDITDSKKWSLAAHATNIATICVLAATLVVQVLVIYFQLWQSVRWYRFKKIGASFEIKRLYSFFQIHRSLLIFDFFFFLAFTVQFLVIMVREKSSVEFILTCCMLPLTILVLLASDFAATKEWLWLTLLTICCFVAGCVYVLFKVIRLYTKYTSAYRIAVVPGQYFPGRTSLVAFGVITLIFLFSTLVMEGFMIYGYNRGLLPLVDRSYKTPGETFGESAQEDLID